MGRIKTEGDRVNLKAGGLLPITGGARVLAMRHGSQTYSTHDRLDAARAQKLANERDLTNVMAAHETLMEFTLRQQLADIKAGVPPSTKVETANLSKPDYARLRDALRQVEVMNTIIGDPQTFG
ncbi:MAG: putative nucleotidyltransferase substrate binding domain-containing protein [Pseudomonadota bacterium]